MAPVPLIQQQSNTPNMERPAAPKGDRLGSGSAQTTSALVGIVS